jgi:hypothetical protein
MEKSKPKFSGLSDAIKEAQQHPTDAAERTETRPATRPAESRRQGRAPGKRSDPAWRQHTVMLKRETHIEASDILRRQESGPDISELLQSLLEQWVKRQHKT